MPSSTRKRKRPAVQPGVGDETGSTTPQASVADVLMAKCGMWANGTEQKKKKRTRQRADARRLTTFDRPEMFTKTRTDNLLLVMAYCGLAGISFRQCTLPKPTSTTRNDIGKIARCGAIWECARDMYDTYTSCVYEFVRTLLVLHAQNNPDKHVNSYTKLTTLLRECLSTHTLTIIPETVNGKCDIDGKDIKHTDTAYMVVLQQFVYTRDSGGKVDYNRVELFPPTPPVVINKKYVQMCFAAWYLFNLNLLVGNDCRMWAESVQRMPLAERKKNLPTFDISNHESTAKLYIETMSTGCNNVRDKIELHTKFFKKVTSDYKKKIKLNQDPASGEGQDVTVAPGCPAQHN